MTDKPNQPGAAKEDEVDLSTLDVEFVRVLEDLIDALLANGTLRVTDLPPQALAKLTERKRLRNRLRSPLDLIEEPDDLL